MSDFRGGMPDPEVPKLPRIAVDGQRNMPYQHHLHLDLAQKIGTGQAGKTGLRDDGIRDGIGASCGL